MELTKKDRIVLINQYEILKRLDPDNADHYGELCEILRNGYEYFYSMIDKGADADMPSKEGRLVVDILDFYRSVEDYKYRHPDDKELSEHPWGTFKGFDGNNETNYMAFARFLIERQSKFTEQMQYREQTDNFNSHSRTTLPKYRRIVAKWYEKGREYMTSKEVILEVLNG
jgi:uncharacterized protein YfbU (UPF0304 family)